MSRQYFADVLSEPINADFPAVTAISETVLIPTLFTGINALDPKAGKVYELLVGGTFTTGLAGTLTITPRFGTTISGTSLGISPAQNYVPSVTNAPFILRCWLSFRTIGLAGANSTCVCHGEFHAGGAVATAGSSTAIMWASASAVSVDTSIANALWIGVTASVADSIVPRFHLWRSLN